MVLKEFNVGDEPFKILNVDSKIENLDIAIDITASYRGNAVVDGLIDVGFAKIPIKITNIKIKEVKMRLFLNEFNSDSPPFFSEMKFAFIEDPLPNFDWDLHNLAGFAEIPGFDELILHIIDRKFKKKFVLPHMINIPIL